MRKITLTEALAELKLLDKKIIKNVNELRYNKVPVIDYVIGKNQVTELSRNTKDELEKNTKSKLDKIADLMRNRNTLKAAIARQNAITEVQVNGKTYTIVEAIERKNGLKMEKDFLNILVDQYDYVTSKVNGINERARNEVNKLLEAKLSSDSKNQSAEEIDKLTKILLESKEAHLVDPSNIKEIIDVLSDEIENFERDVDVALSIVNAKTEIEIDF